MISRETHYVLFPSKDFHDEIQAITPADDETQKEVLRLLEEKKMNISQGIYLAPRPNKQYMIAEVGFKFMEGNQVREITKMERVSKGIILVTHAESKL